MMVGAVKKIEEATGLKSDSGNLGKETTWYGQEGLWSGGRI